MIELVLKEFGFDSDTIKKLTVEGIKQDDFLQILKEKKDELDDKSLSEIKKGLSPEIRAELKEELEKGLVAEKFKKFKKDLAKDLGVHEYGAKVAEAEYKEFLEMLKSVKKNDSADEAIQKENDELRAKIQEAIAKSDEVEQKYNDLIAEIPVKYIDKSIYTKKIIDESKLKKVSNLKDLPYSADLFLSTLNGELHKRGITESLDDKNEIVLLKDGKPYQDDKFKSISYDSFINEIFESIKPKSGGVPAGGLGLDGKHTQRYISPSELEMMGN